MTEDVRITTDALGRTVYYYVGRDGSLRTAVAPGQYVCDFCTASEPTWAFPCGPMMVVGNPLMNASDDQWLTCDCCHDLLEEGDIEGLAQHAVKMQKSQDVQPGWESRQESVALDIVRTNGRAFWLHVRVSLYGSTQLLGNY